MKKRRIESFLMLATLFVINILALFWLQGRPIATVWANGLAAPAAPVAVVSIPRTFSYQGTLRDANGDLINGTVNLTLKLYAAVTGGDALYTESFANVNVRSGLFSVVVGDVTPIPPTVFDNFPLYLGLSVNQDAEMLPRQRLHPVPYAMQASSAQIAVAANNLTEGGGVAGLVTLGAGGRQELAFASGGKISGDQNGVTIDAGSTEKQVTIVGDWSAGAIHDIGDSNGGANQRSTYPVSISRYVVEAPDNSTSPDTVPVDDAILTQLCQDEDGCSVNLYMRNWDAAHEGGLLAGAGPFRMSLAPAVNGKRQWNINEPAGTGSSGIDKDGSIGHLMNVYNSCYFTDGEYTNGQGSDGALGFGLLNWYGAFNGAYDSTNMTCVLIIED